MAVSSMGSLTAAASPALIEVHTPILALPPCHPHPERHWRYLLLLFLGFLLSSLPKAVYAAAKQVLQPDCPFKSDPQAPPTVQQFCTASTPQLGEPASFFSLPHFLTDAIAFWFFQGKPCMISGCARTPLPVRTPSALAFHPLAVGLILHPSNR